MKLEEKLVPTRGEFTIETYDLEDNLINTYTDNNKIMARVPFNFACITYGADCNGFRGEFPTNLSVDDFQIHTVAIGTDGVDEEGIPREIQCNRDMLFSEQKMWLAQASGDITEDNNDMDKYVYQSTFNTVPNDSSDEDKMMPAQKVNEGPSFPWDFGTNQPGYYRMVPDGTNGLLFPDTSMEITSNHKELVLKYEFTLGQFAGNGIWQLAPGFSEAGLYMRYVPSHLDVADPLGALFSMKTFPTHYKTEACYFRIKWKLIFGTDTCTDKGPKITILGDNPYIFVINPQEDSEGPIYEGPVSLNSELLGLTSADPEDDVYVDPGATAYDAEDGDITDRIIVSGVEQVDLTTPGEYLVSYYVEDSSGNSDSKTRIVRVQGNEQPVITLVGDPFIELNIGDTYIEYGATAYDAEDGIITDDIIIDSSNVDTSTLGQYIVTYNVTDSDGLAAEEVIRTVNVVSGVPTCDTYESTTGVYVLSNGDNYCLGDCPTYESTTGEYVLSNGDRYCLPT